MVHENSSGNSTGPEALHKNTGIAVCFSQDHPAIKAVRVTAYAVILLISLLGNSLVIGVVWKDRRMRKPVNYLIANMAAADLVITVMYMPRMMSAVIVSYDWCISGAMGLTLCKLVPALHLVSIKVSILTLVFLSGERFLAVSAPGKRSLTFRKVKIIIFSVWLVSFVVHVPNLFALKLTPGKGGALICRAYLNSFFGSSKGRKIYDNILAVIFYAVPLFLIILLYSLTCIKLRRRRRRKLPGSSNVNSPHIRKEKMNRNVFRMLFAVTLAFISCWLCYFIMRQGIIGIRIFCNVQFIRYFLAHMNSAITPCLYVVFSQKYRSGFKCILRRLACCSLIRTRSGTIASRYSVSCDSLGLSTRGVALLSLRVMKD